MGSEQSVQGASNKNVGKQELPEAKKQPDRDGACSPGPSICSDSDVPYVSYTVNRPIGDSPKQVNKSTTKKVTTKKKLTQKLKKSTHNIVIVKPASHLPDASKDPEIRRLEQIPMFLPIMRGTISTPVVREPEVLERLDPGPLVRLCSRYQSFLAESATAVAKEQAILTSAIKEIETEINRLLATATERQKRFAKHAENLAKVQEVSRCLIRCHTTLNQSLESAEMLNNALSASDRLEPFVWTTG